MEHEILASYSTPLLVADQEGKIHYANPAAGDFWHTSPERLGELSVGKLFGRTSAVTEQVRRTLREEMSFTIDGYSFSQGEGQPPLMLRVNVDPILTPNQPASLVLISFWDETTRQRLTDADQEKRVMDSIGLMVWRLAHELQNPLSGVKGATQLLFRRLSEQPELAEYATVILRELERLERLVRSLLSQGGEPQLQKSTFNLHEMLDGLIWFQSNAKPGRKIVRDYDPSLPDLHADRDRLHQVFLNLLQNAEESSPPGGQITVRTRSQGRWQEREGRQGRAGTWIVVEVEDQGPGVAAENLDNLFTPLFTTKKNGHGVGLSLCYQIMRAHGAQIRYRRAVHGGALFSVLLPLEEP